MHILQKETQHQDEERVLEELAASTAGIAAEVAIRVRRQLEGRNNDNENGVLVRRKRRRLSSCFQHERARLSIEIDNFSPTPVFDDRQFE